MYDYSKLFGKIREICGTNEEFCKRLDISGVSFYNKIKGKTAFTQKEIQNSMDILNIPIDTVANYFFCQKSWENPNN